MQHFYVFKRCSLIFSVFRMLGNYGGAQVQRKGEYDA